MSANFRDHLRTADDPRITGLAELDAYSHADRVLRHPVAHQLFEGWRALYEQTEFKGITTHGECVPGLFKLQDEQAPVQACVQAVEHLLQGLTSEQKAVVQHAHNARQWRAWMNPEVYMMRFGLRLDELQPNIREDILAVLRASLSVQGFERARHLMKINQFLGELVHAPHVMNEYSYNFNLFGKPSITEPWGWNFYGHHLCLNCRYIGTQMVLTPVFMGAEPHVMDIGPLSGIPVFEKEESQGLRLMQSLPHNLQQQARLYAQKRDPAMPPGRIALGDELTLTGAFQDNRIVAQEGLPAKTMPVAQQTQLLDLIHTYLSYLPEGPRAARMRENQAHLANTWFCWIGGIDDESPFYYRIQSPVLIIEFDHHAGVFLGNSTPEKFHVHTIVRTPNGNDYGMDLVRQHCECMQKVSLARKK
jgi:hypothetical protein